LFGALFALVQALEYDQAEYRHQAQKQEEQVLRHDLPPPVEELGVDEDDEEGGTGLGTIRAAGKQPVLTIVQL